MILWRSSACDVTECDPACLLFPSPKPLPTSTMPRAPRKSSLGTRRGPPREHIPFRADDLARGKKTGIAVQYVDRNSDEFEPFDELMKQADNRTPPRIKSKKRRVSVITPVRQEVDEYGEMSMDIAESNQGSPLAYSYLANANPSYLLGSARRPSMPRPIPQSSTIDYDEIPSPRRRPSAPSTRMSVANGAGPSYISKPYSSLGRDRELETPDLQDDHQPPELDAVDDVHPLMDEAEGDVAEVEEELAAIPKKANKGKHRATPENDTHPELYEMNGVEDDIMRGLAEVENEGQDEGDDPQSSKGKSTRGQEQKSKKPRGRSAKRVLPASELELTPEGVRRGRRHRFKPLEWWRQEKVVYGRGESGLTLVPQIKEIVRIPKEPPKPLGTAGKRWRKGSSRAKSRTRDIQTPMPPINPEEGWDDDTTPEGIVFDYVSREFVRRRLAHTANMFEPRPVGNSNWLFHKIFGEDDFIAAGLILIPPQGRKPSKAAKDNAYIFYVIEGAVSVVIHETPYLVASGGMFLIPRGNTYYIENVCERDVKLFFTQARRLPIEHTAHSVPPVSHRRKLSEVDGSMASASPSRAKSRH